MKFARLQFLAIIGAVGLCMNPASGQGTLQITFDGPPSQPPGTQFGVTSYSESGMFFTPIDTNTAGSQFTRNGGGISGYPDNGTPYLQAGDPLAFSFTDGSPFGLASVDLAGYSSVVPDFTIDFVGYLVGGGTVTNSFSGTGINFQTFHFNPDFNDVTRVEIDAPDWSLDNLVVSVPEPGVFALLTLGVVIFARRHLMK